ncbi:glycosyltransferase family 4 protein [Candidatus Parcubacteria bacterium]|nr:glycosyltransferase family 4 protein [Candidatus Parcubacteria bacterium]
MKIGIDIRTLMDIQYSGIPEYTLNLIKEILKLDKKNEYKLFYNSGKDVSNKIPKFASNSAEIIKTNYPNKLFNNVMQRVLGMPKIDQLLGADLFFMPNIGFVSLSNQCKKIITVHDLSFLRFPEFFSLKRRAWHSIVGVKKMLNQFDKVIAVSENTKNDLIDLCDIKEEKIKVIYHGVGGEYKAIEPNSQELNEIKRKYNLPDDFILYLGTLEPRKNVEGIIQAYGELREKNRGLENFKLVIAGGRGWKYKNIFKIWNESKYKDSIIFLGYVDSADKVYLYNLASLFVYPSFYEGFGLQLLEAMACGTPVTCSFASSLPEVAGDAAVMVDPYNIAHIAGAIEQILTDNELKKDLIKKGLARAKHFSWEKTAKEYLELFDNFNV